MNDAPKTLVSALYAENPDDRKGMGLGKAALAIGKNTDGEPKYERHFRRLLACEEIEELGGQLHRLVKRLDRDGIGLDYEALLIGLYTWCKTSEPQKRANLKIRWAADFWNAQLPKSDEEAPS